MPPEGMRPVPFFSEIGTGKKEKKEGRFMEQFETFQGAPHEYRMYVRKEKKQK